MAKYFKIDGKTARAAITKGEFIDFYLVVNVVSFRKAIYVFDSNTKVLIKKFNSITSALRYAKVNFYTIKTLIDNKTSYLGKIYRYKDKL